MGYVVYRHINPVTFNTFYVGIGSIKRPYDFHNRGIFWKRYVNKYGNPIVLVESMLIELPLAMRFEKELISFYGRKNNKTGCLVNLTDGGDGVNGININDEVRRKMSLSKIGKKLNINTVLKIARSNTGKKRSAETKRLIGLKSMGRNSKMVINLQTGIYYNSIKEAASSTNINHVYFQQQVNGIRKNKTDFILA